MRAVARASLRLRRGHVAGSVGSRSGSAGNSSSRNRNACTVAKTPHGPGREAGAARKRGDTEALELQVSNMCKWGEGDDDKKVAINERGRGGSGSQGERIRMENGKGESGGMSANREQTNQRRLCQSASVSWNEPVPCISSGVPACLALCVCLVVCG